MGTRWRGLTQENHHNLVLMTVGLVFGSMLDLAMNTPPNLAFANYQPG